MVHVLCSAKRAFPYLTIEKTSNQKRQLLQVVKYTVLTWNGRWSQSPGYDPQDARPGSTPSPHELPPLIQPLYQVYNRIYPLMNTNPTLITQYINYQIYLDWSLKLKINTKCYVQKSNKKHSVNLYIPHIPEHNRPIRSTTDKQTFMYGVPCHSCKPSIPYQQCQGLL